MTRPTDPKRSEPTAKPPGMSCEAWADRLIRDAEAAGEFDNLPGAGKPIPGVDGPYDENWWIKDKLKREDVSGAPEVIRARRRVDELRGALADCPTESALRSSLVRLREATARANAMALPPGTRLLPAVDDAAEISRWKAARERPR